MQDVSEKANRNSGNLAVVRAALVAGLYPNVVRVEMPASQSAGGKGRGGRGGRAPARKTPPKLTTRVRKTTTT